MGRWLAVRGAAATGGAGGFSLVELLIALALAGTVAAIGAPVTAHAIDATVAREAAGFLAARFRAARARAVEETRSIGVVFDRDERGWVFRVCRDGNENGMRRADLASGADPCFDGPYDLARLFAGVEIALDASIPDPDGQSGSTDAVRFGKSAIASFSDSGTCTAGTVFLRSAKGRQYAVRLSNVTGRTRILRYDSGSKTWIAA